MVKRSAQGGCARSPLLSCRHSCDARARRSKARLPELKQREPSLTCVAAALSNHSSQTIAPLRTLCSMTQSTSVARARKRLNGSTSHADSWRKLVMLPLPAESCDSTVDSIVLLVVPTTRASKDARYRKYSRSSELTASMRACPTSPGCDGAPESRPIARRQEWIWIYSQPSSHSLRIS